MTRSLLRPGAWRITLLLLTALASGIAQTAGTSDDGSLQTAGMLVGKALFLRGFYLNDALTYDAEGKVKGSPKVGDWTVAAVNVLTVERRGPGEIELDGVRAAVRYNNDNHEFERHVLKDEKVKVIVTDPGDTKRLEAAFARIFAVGIDPELQRSMPDYWRHYFDPSLAWPQDGLNAQSIVLLYGPNQAKDVTAPKVDHRVEARYDDFALKDRVQGEVQLRLVVDAEGAPRRITIGAPLGYGLDASAVEAMQKWRFSPGIRGGDAVVTGVVVREQFTLTNRTP